MESILFYMEFQLYTCKIRNFTASGLYMYEGQSINGDNESISQKILLESELF